MVKARAAIVAFVLLLASPLPIRAKQVRSTVVYDDIATEVSAIDGDAAQLWISTADLTRATHFELKPQGVCRGQLCFPVPKTRASEFVRKDSGTTFFNLLAFAQLVNQPVAHNEALSTWYFGLRSDQREGLSSLQAPDFNLPDMAGKMHSLSDFRRKKVLLVTWASWWGCRFDLPGWQAIYQQLKDKNFEVISVAQDTNGVKDAGPWIDAAKSTYTALIDEKHLVSKLYNMVNVPTGVWINEVGKIVRPNEVAFVDDRFKTFTGLDAEPYLTALKDWVAKGGKSAYAMSEEKLRERLSVNDPNFILAAAQFGLGEYLYKNGHLTEAILHFKEAQRLNPKSWNYKRQAYALSDAKRDYGTTFADEVQKAGGSKVYYQPPDLPAADKKP